MECDTRFKIMKYILIALDGSIKILDNVEGHYLIGKIPVIRFKDGCEKYYTNFKIMNIIKSRG